MRGKDLGKPIFDEIDFEKAIATPAEVFQQAKLGRPVTYVTEDGCFQVTKILDSFMCDLMNKVPGTVKTTQEIEDECDAAQAFRRSVLGIPKYNAEIASVEQDFSFEKIQQKLYNSMLHRDSFMGNERAQHLRKVYIEGNREVEPKELTYVESFQALAKERNNLVSEFLLHKFAFFDFVLGIAVGIACTVLSFLFG